MARNIVSWAVGIGAALLGILMCLAIPAMPYIAISATAGFAFSLACLPPTRKFFPALKSRTMTTLWLGGAVVAGFAGLILVGTQRQKHTISQADIAQVAEQVDRKQAVAEGLFREAFAAKSKGNFAQAARLFQVSADSGYAPAQYYAGLMYSEGVGVAKDKRRAIELIRMSAEARFSEAQWFLGTLYRTGPKESGIPVDPKKAVEWLQKAEAQGNANAQQGLCLMYLTGDGVPKDLNKAVPLCRKAADQNLASAQQVMGLIYKGGFGVVKDQNAADIWFAKAKKNGFVANNISKNTDPVLASNYKKFTACVGYFSELSMMWYDDDNATQERISQSIADKYRAKSATVGRSLGKSDKEIAKDLRAAVDRFEKNDDAFVKDIEGCEKNAKSLGFIK